MDQAIQALLSTLELGQAQEPPGFVVVPIVAPSQPGADYVPLGDALAGGQFSVTEVSEAGSVPQLLAVNKGERSVLLVDGEELAGAKQNRIINVSILVPARAELPIPVSCTERGRWRHVSSTFAESGVVAAPSVRRTLNRSVMARAERSGDYGSDQNAVWAQVSALFLRGGTRSDTSAMRDAFDAHRAPVEEVAAKVPLVDGQVGMAVLRPGEVVGMDYVGRPEAYAAVHSKLVASYALEYGVIERAAPDETEGASAGGAGASALDAANAAVAAVGEFVAALLATSDTEQPGVGDGTIHTLRAGGVVGTALVADGAVVHLNAFRAG
jgi:hypothetical protein